MATVAAVAYEVDQRSREPSYRQLAALLRKDIETGVIPAGGLLPSIRDLVQQTGLAPKTVQHAIRLLEGEGLVRVVPGRGTWAAE